MHLPKKVLSSERLYLHGAFSIKRPVRSGRPDSSPVRHRPRRRMRAGMRPWHGSADRLLLDPPDPMALEVLSCWGTCCSARTTRFCANVSPISAVARRPGGSLPAVDDLHRG